tara:strand:+ start:361 stop:1062 length:702 start_codon:yes stop_codon:yes gene_type:complete
MKNKLKKYKKKHQITLLRKFQEESLLFYDEFLANSSYDRIQKIIWKYELFKKIIDIPGDIVECGVHKGSGIYLYSKLLKIFKPNSLTKVVGFDFFGKPQKIKNKFGIDFKVNQNHIGNGSKEKKIIKNLEKYNIKNIKLVAGDVCVTTKQYTKKNIGFRISMLILDVDNYEGTLECLKNLYPNVTRGGIIVLDEYALEKYGESDAVDEFIKNKKLKIRSAPWSSTPSAYIIKK